MSLLTGSTNDFFGLDIGTSNIRLVKLGGADKNKALQTYAYSPIDPKISMSDSKADQQQVAMTIKSIVAKANIHTKNVAVGLASQRVFTTVVDIDKLSKEELAKSIKYQADSLIPTPISESKIDWQLLGESPRDKSKVEILLSSVANEFAEARLDMLEGIGLNVIAFEPDSIAMVRSLIDPAVQLPQMIIDIGNSATDLVMVLNGSPRLSRTIPTGIEAIVRSAVQNLNIDEAQARQFVSKFGLNQQKLEGQVFNAISGTVDLLMTEVEKSIKFFNARYQGVKLDRAIVTGGAAILPEFPVYLANRFNINVEVGNSWRNVSYSTDRQNELMAISSQFAVAVGLAERKV